MGNILVSEFTTLDGAIGVLTFTFAHPALQQLEDSGPVDAVRGVRQRRRAPHLHTGRLRAGPAEDQSCFASGRPSWDHSVWNVPSASTRS